MQITQIVGAPSVHTYEYTSAENWQFHFWVLFLCSVSIFFWMSGIEPVICYMVSPLSYSLFKPIEDGEDGVEAENRICNVENV